jgi:hypothetical protein
VLTGPQAAAAFRAWEAGARPGAMRLPLVALTANIHEQVRDRRFLPRSVRRL